MASQHDQYQQRMRQYKAMLRHHLEDVARRPKAVVIAEMALMLDISHATSWRMFKVASLDPHFVIRGKMISIAKPLEVLV